jgi:hypothetical protein
MLGPHRRQIVYLVAVACAICFAFLVGEGTERQNERIQIETANKTKNAVKEQNSAQNGGPLAQPPSNPKADNRTEQTPDINVLGVRPGEAILAFITFLLCLATVDLVETSKDAAQRQLRAYVSGGGWRARNERETPIGVPVHPNAHVIPTASGRWTVIEPIDFFDIHINNHGQTPARLHHIRFGFFDATAPVPDEPPYGDRIVQVDAIGSPRNQSKFVRRVEYPATRWARMAICGRFYWTDVLDREWSSGFVYEIASGNAAQNDSISIEAPRVYWEDRRELDLQ